MAVQNLRYHAPTNSCGAGCHVSVTQPNRSRVHAEPRQVLLLASVGTELSQAVWPRGVFAGRFDLWDIVAYATGMVAVYGADRLCGAARQAKT
jgi:hypothetical protein